MRRPGVEGALEGGGLVGEIWGACLQEPAQVAVVPRVRAEHEGVAVFNAWATELVGFEVADRASWLTHQLDRLHGERACDVESSEALEPSEGCARRRRQPSFVAGGALLVRHVAVPVEIALSFEDLDALLASTGDHRTRTALFHVQPLSSVTREPSARVDTDSVVDLMPLASGNRPISGRWPWRPSGAMP